MIWLADSFEAIRDFMELGGQVLTWIAITIFLMWVLIIERLMYFRTSMKVMSKEIHDAWENRTERRSWNAHQIREMMISRFDMATNKGIIVQLAADPEWFDSRRFVIGRPRMLDGFKFVPRASLEDWRVIDLKTSKPVIIGLTVEDSGLYADVLEDKYNAVSEGLSSDG